MSRRSSLNDQGFRAITEMILLHRHNDKAAKRTHVARRLCLGGAGLLGEARYGDGYAIGGTSQQTTGIKLTPQPYREEIGPWRSVQLRGFPCLAPVSAGARPYALTSRDDARLPPNRSPLSPQDRLRNFHMRSDDIS